MMTPMARPDLPAVQAWLGRLGERQAFHDHARNGIP
jgi:glutathione S-transferase